MSKFPIFLFFNVLFFYGCKVDNVVLDKKNFNFQEIIDDALLRQKMIYGYLEESTSVFNVCIEPNIDISRVYRKDILALLPLDLNEEFQDLLSLSNAQHVRIDTLNLIKDLCLEVNLNMQNAHIALIDPIIKNDKAIVTISVDLIPKGGVVYTNFYRKESNKWKVIRTVELMRF